MATTSGLIDRLAPDCIVRLKQAARMRFAEAATLQDKHRLAAIYWYGYSVEMCLAAAYFQNAGLAPDQTIDRGMRNRLMANARRMKLMKSDPHPLVGWAEMLRWQSLQGKVDSQRRRLLDIAVDLAKNVYRHWRPELRYQVIMDVDVLEDYLDEVRTAAKWFLDNQPEL